MADGGVCPLFDAQVLEDIDYSCLNSFQQYGISLSSPGDGLRMRPLERSDFSKGYKELLSQLTVVGDLTQERFEEQFDEMRSCPGTYYVVVIEVSGADAVCEYPEYLTHYSVFTCVAYVLWIHVDSLSLS